MPNAITQKEVVGLLKTLIESNGPSETALSIGISRQYLYDVVRSQRQPGKRVLEFLGLEKIVAVTYRSKRRRR